ncbi:MAG: hypothetical protein RID07_09880, partial [Lacipirellulaceae bacterium]
RGITLLELLLVAALLAVIASLAAPPLGRAFSSVKLRRTGDEVLAAWTEARNTAIHSGRVHQFRFEPGTARYQVSVWASEESESSASETGGTDSISLADAKDATDPEIVFESGQLVDEQSRDRSSTEPSEVVSLKSSGGEEWSRPLLFFPNGTTSDATITLKNKYDKYLRLHLRGLTGVGRKSAVLTRTEWDEAQDR